MNKKTVVGALSALSLLLIPITSSNVAQAMVQKKTSPSWLNVRSGPSVNYKIVTSVKQNTIVTIVQDRSGWDKISVNGKTGYVNERYLKNYTAPVSAKSIGKKVVNTGSSAERLNVRKSTTTYSSIIGKLTNGSVIDIYAVSGTWAKVKYGTTYGYVHTAFLKTYVAPVSATSIGKKVVNTGTDTLNVRKSTSSTSSILGKLKNDTVVDIYAVSGTWAKVKYGTTFGYVHTAFLKNYVAPVAAPKPVSTTPTTSTTTYKVQSGDTLWSISKKFSTSVASLKTLNKLTSDRISLGQVLSVSGTASTVTPVSSPVIVKKELAGKTIVLDPGHGGTRPGAISNGIVEKEINLDVSKRAKALLERAGARVILTRSTDTDCRPGVTLSYDLQCRADVSKTYNADMFLSIHANAAGSAARGAETFYYATSSKNLALTIQKNYIEATGLYYRSVRLGNFHVIRKNTVPSALLELGFLTNAGDSAKMKTSSFRDAAARGIHEGIVDYFN